MLSGIFHAINLNSLSFKEISRFAYWLIDWLCGQWIRSNTTVAGGLFVRLYTSKWSVLNADFAWNSIRTFGFMAFKLCIILVRLCQFKSYFDVFNAPDNAEKANKSKRNTQHTTFKCKPLAITSILICLVLPHCSPFSPRTRSFNVNLIAVQVNKNHEKISSTLNDHWRIRAK